MMPRPSPDYQHGVVTSPFVHFTLLSGGGCYLCATRPVVSRGGCPRVGLAHHQNKRRCNLLQNGRGA